MNFSWIDDDCNGSFLKSSDDENEIFIYIVDRKAFYYRSNFQSDFSEIKLKATNLSDAKKEALDEIEKNIHLMKRNIDSIINSKAYWGEVPPGQKSDVHTEHCCIHHGCKYNQENCSVVSNKKIQSGKCEGCYLRDPDYYV